MVRAESLIREQGRQTGVLCAVRIGDVIQVAGRRQKIPGSSVVVIPGQVVCFIVFGHIDGLAAELSEIGFWAGSIVQDHGQSHAGACLVPDRRRVEVECCAGIARRLSDQTVGIEGCVVRPNGGTGQQIIRIARTGQAVGAVAQRDRCHVAVNISRWQSGRYMNVAGKDSGCGISRCNLIRVECGVASTQRNIRYSRPGKRVKS